MSDGYSETGAWAVLAFYPGSEGPGWAVHATGSITRWADFDAAEAQAARKRTNGWIAVVAPWAEEMWIETWHGRCCSIASPAVLANPTIRTLLGLADRQV